MIYRPLGRSDLSISAIGFGCMSLGQDERENTRLIDRAIGLGINFFDTADIYERGLNEEKIGRILKAKREQVVIASKVGNVWRDEGADPGRGSEQRPGGAQGSGSAFDWDPSPQHIRRSIEGTLKRLGTDRIDLYQLHGGTMEDRIDETIGAFEDLVREGKIRYYGISSIRPAVIGEYVRRGSIVSVMMQYSLLDRRPDEPHPALGGERPLDYLHRHGIGVLARGSLAKGLLIDKAPAGFLEYDAAEVRAAAAAIRDVSNVDPNVASNVGSNVSGPSRNPAQTALQYVLQNPAITSAVVGFRTMEQLENVMKEGPETDVANTPFLPIPEQENERLNGSIRRLTYR